MKARQHLLSYVSSLRRAFSILEEECVSLRVSREVSLEVQAKPLL
jgi:hypothetical protein